MNVVTEVVPQQQLASAPAISLTNVKLVLEDRVIDGGLHIENGRISALAPAAGGEVIDCGGDYLLPGLVDLHTDNVEHYFFPRPGVHWSASLMAVLAHDAQMLAAGITTVFDSLSLGEYDGTGRRSRLLKDAIDAITQAVDQGLMWADHYFHFRCELSDAALADIVVPYLDSPLLKLLSVMDHTPGQRQWWNLDLFRNYRRTKNGLSWSDEEFDAYMVERRRVQAQFVPTYRKMIHEAGLARNIPIASHDDTTIADVDDSQAHGIAISEFPTTIEAAQHAHDLGMKIVMGAPNVVLGRSHSGNVSATTLADEGLLDILTSDYVPSSLLHAPFILAERGMPLAKAVATVTAEPAATLNLTDRGRIAEGLRADLVRVRLVDGMPIVRGVWVTGRSYL
jgi:alpha-D-ribose 1-methylphosphonate 5-triphosphate diphosphatase